MFRFRDGIQLEDTSIWCDAPRGQALAFLSHSGKRGAWHRATKVLTTEATLARRAALGRAKIASALIAPEGRPFSLGALRLELAPSGFCEGAAQLVVSTKKSRRVYAADLSPDGGYGAQGARVVDCDALALWVTALGVTPERRLQAEKRLLREVAANSKKQRVSCIVAPIDDGLEEIALVLAHAGVPFLTDARARKLLARHAKIGEMVRVLSPRREPQAGEVLLWPVERLDAIRRRKLRGMAWIDSAVTGAISNRASLDALVTHVRRAGVKEVYLAPGAPPALARALLALRPTVRILVLGGAAQMSLFDRDE